MTGSLENAMQEFNKEWEHLRLRMYFTHTLAAIAVSLVGLGVGIYTYVKYGDIFGVFVLGSTAGVLIMFVIFALLIWIEIIRSKKGAKK